MRYAVKCNATIISVNYRLAPKDKAPSGLLDACGALLWILDPTKSVNLRIDHERIAVFGDDAGGWITMAVCQYLSKFKKNHKLRFQMLMEPQTGSLYKQKDVYLNAVEKEMQKTMVKVVDIIGKNHPDDKEYTVKESLLFPNMDTEDLVHKMPPAIILTTEFGYNRKMAEEAGVLFLKADKLLEFGCIAGTFHNFYTDFDL